MALAPGPPLEGTVTYRRTTFGQTFQMCVSTFVQSVKGSAVKRLNGQPLVINQNCDHFEADMLYNVFCITLVWLYLNIVTCLAAG